MSRVIHNLLPLAHLSREDAVDSLLGRVDWHWILDPTTYAAQGEEQESAFRAIVRQAYDLGYQAAVLDTQARAVEHGATGGGKRSPAQQQQTARLNGIPLTPTPPTLGSDGIPDGFRLDEHGNFRVTDPYAVVMSNTTRQAPGNPWTEDEDAAVLRGEFPETHTRGACYARRSRLRRQMKLGG